MTKKQRHIKYNIFKTQNETNLYWDSFKTKFILEKDFVAYNPEYDDTDIPVYIFNNETLVGGFYAWIENGFYCIMNIFIDRKYMKEVLEELQIYLKEQFKIHKTEIFFVCVNNKLKSIINLCVKRMNLKKVTDIEKDNFCNRIKCPFSQCRNGGCVWDLYVKNVL